MKNHLPSFVLWLSCLLLVSLSNLAAQNVADNWCQKAIDISCGTPLNDQTTVGGTNQIVKYPDCNNYTFAGPEKVYKLVTTAAGDLQVDLTIHTNYLDLDILLLKDDCSTVTCLDHSITSNANSNRERITYANAPAGTYYIVVDSEKDEGAFNILATCATSTPCNLEYTLKPSHIGCGGSKGAIEVDISWGMAPFKIEWDNSNNSVWGEKITSNKKYTIPNLAAGIYTVKVIDSKSCLKMKTVEIKDAGGGFSINVHSTDAVCGGTGFINIDITGSSPPYWISVKGPVSGTAQAYSNNTVIKDIPPGDYEVTVEKGNCTKTAWVTVKSSNKLDFVLEASDASCNDYGSVWVTIKSGTPDFTVEWWSPGISKWAKTDKTSFKLPDLPPGDYTVKITDAKGCEKVQYITVKGSSGLDFVLEASDASCNDYGSVWVTIKSGTPDFTVEWWGPGISKWAKTDKTSFKLPDLPPGDYTVKITDAKGCEKVQYITVKGSSGLDFVLEASDASCNDYGSVWVTIKSGTPDFTVEWWGPGISKWAKTDKTSFKLPDLPPGDYTVKITDAKGCEKVQYITVKGSSGLDFVLEANDASCNDYGSVWVTIKSGTPDFTVEWWGPGISKWAKTDKTSFKLPDLPPGDYTVKITDAKGCEKVQYITVKGSSGLDFVLEASDASCNDYGSVWVTIKSGTPDFTVEWWGPGISKWAKTDKTSFKLPDLPPGDYTVKITDAKGCEKVQYITVKGSSGLDFVLEANDASCNDYGSVWVTIKSGTPDFTVEWWGSGISKWAKTDKTSFKLPDLPPGDYTVKITDAKGCEKVQYITVKGSSGLDFSLEASSASCSAKGSIWVSINSGTPGFTVEWSGPSGSNWFNTNNTGFRIEGLLAGDYTIHIIDKHGCKKTQYITVKDVGGDLDFSLEAKAASCNDYGAIWVEIKNGHPAFTVEWWGPNVSKWAKTDYRSFQLKDLPAGNYTVKITDSKGCMNTQYITIGGGQSDLSLSLEVNDASCDKDGRVWVTINGGTGPYRLSWSGPISNYIDLSSNGYSIEGLIAGNYTISVSDKHNCSFEQYITIRNTGSNLSLSLEANKASCGQNGYVWVTASNGTAPYYISWEGPRNGNASSNNGGYQINDLPAGQYKVTAHDKNNCKTESYVTVYGSGPFTLEAQSSVAECDKGGQIWLTMNGGEAPFRISLAGPMVGSTLTSDYQYHFSNLPAGEYTITVKDKNDCIVTKKITIISNNSGIDFSLEANNALCGQGGSVWVTINSGSSTYDISWSGPTSGATSTGENGAQISNLPKGTYSFTVKDKNGCSSSKSITINDASSSLSLSLEANNASCGQKGSIWVTIGGGSPNYTISWSGPTSGSATATSTGYQITNLPGGLYQVFVKDYNGCATNESIQVVNTGNNVSVHLETVNGVACGSGGIVNVTINNGTPNYTISWTGPTSGSATSSDNTYQLNGLKNGEYTVSVLDKNDCGASNKITIYDSGSDLQVALEANKAICGKGGAIWVTLSNGVPNYTVTWYGGGVTGSIQISDPNYQITGLPVGTYTIEAKDGIGCSTEATVNVNDDGSEVNFGLSTTNVACNKKGNIQVNITSGGPDFTVSWSGPTSGSQTTSSNGYRIENLPAGTYTVTVEDANGCSNSKAVAISGTGSDISLSANVTGAACDKPSSIQVTVSNGVPNFSISWSGPVSGSISTTNNSHTITDLPAGTYTVSVIDGNGCQNAQSVTLRSSSNNINFTHESSPASCNSSGSIWLTIIDGQSPYTISWSGPVSGTSTSSDEGVRITGLVAGDYTVRVQDYNSCVITQTTKILDEGGGSNNVNFAYKALPVTCNGPGSILLTMISGAAPYSVSYTGPTNGSRAFSTQEILLENLPEGPYTVTINDASGCSGRTQAINIESNVGPITVTGVANSSVCGGNGSVTLSYSGDRDPYTIDWEGPVNGMHTLNAQTYTVNDLPSGIYKFTVTGYDGCKGETTVTVSSSGNNLKADFSYNVSGKKVTFTNLSTAGNYTWDFGDGNSSTETAPEHTFAQNGTYYVCLTVANACGSDYKCENIVINALDGGGETSAQVEMGEKSGPKGAVLQLPVRVANCSRLATLSGSINIQNTNVAKVNGLSPSAISPIYNPNNQTFSYLAAGLGTTINSETILFYINIELIGEVGETSEVGLFDGPVSLELTCTENGITDPVTPNVTPGRVVISNQLDRGILSGNIKTYWGEGIVDAMVTIKNDDFESYPMTSTEGQYAATEVPMGYEYLIEPSKNTNPVNGLSTFGLFMAQKYLLGNKLEEITSPYQVIAMDANCSGAFTTYDLFIMQQLLIGNLTEFPDCPSWVFIPADHEFPADFSETNVFPYPSTHNMMLDKEDAVVDFVGVKVGDILGRANPAAGSFRAADDRNRKVIPLQIIHQGVKRGEMVEIAFNSRDFYAITSYQLGLNYDAQVLEFLEFIPNKENELSTTVAGIMRNQLTISWFHPQGRGLSLNKHDDLFTLRFTARQDIENVAELLTIINDRLHSEAHNESQDAYHFTLQTKGTEKLSSFELHQNTPNPFHTSTNIAVELPAAMDAQIIVQDHFGRMIQTQWQSFEQGTNVFSINREGLVSGVYYYTVKAGEFVATKRMLIVE